MKFYARFLACLLLLMFCMTSIAEDAVIAPLPLEEDPCYGPKDDCYVYEDGDADPIGYQDDSISVQIESGRYLETNYMAIRVKIADASQLRSSIHGQIHSDATDPAAKQAKRVKAVLAISGDYFTRNNIGYIVRQGKKIRNRCDGHLDILILDEEGDMHILPKASAEDIAAYDGTVVNSYAFGPGLIIDGVAQYNIEYSGVGYNELAQRMGFCQVGKLEYLIVASEGPEDPGSAGLRLEEFTDLLCTFEGVQNAYNLDGGSSATVVFRTAENAYAKINSPNNPKVRYLKDIIYFASAVPNE